MQVRAPAKINLNLRVLARNPVTGFHDIETWMTPVTLADELRVELTRTPGIQLTCSDPDLQTDSGNLAWRAAEIFLEAAEHPGGAKIELHKNIPHGAGLGGGSSDAAAVLTSLNVASGHPLPSDQLLQLAAQLGSDVPFFIEGQAALAKGRGEQLSRHPLPHALDLLLLKPPFGIETAWAYRQWGTAVTVPQRWIEAQEYAGIKLGNDLERPVFAKHLVLAVMKEWLLQQSTVAAAAMSGSGSSLFAILHQGAPADQLAEAARRAFGSSLWTASCRTLR